MKSTFDQLGPKGKALLVDLYEHDSYSALKKLLELERLNIATQLVSVPADDVKNISRLQGRAEMCKQLHLAIKDLYKQEREKER
jgi:hypothetical protein